MSRIVTFGAILILSIDEFALFAFTGNGKQFDILGRQTNKGQGLKVMNGQLIFVGK